MDLAERVVDDATSISEADLQRLRDLGLSETDIMDVVLAASARSFFSKTLDALGVRPDASYRDTNRSCARPSWWADKSQRLDAAKGALACEHALRSDGRPCTRCVLPAACSGVHDSGMRECS